MGRLLKMLGDRIGEEAVDRVWIFPPLVKGRKEWGLAAVSCLTEDSSRRSLVTGRYSAELTGQGVVFEPRFVTEGLVPPHRIPAIMDGVVRRSDLQLGTPRVVAVQGESFRFRAMVQEYAGDLDEDELGSENGTSGPGAGRT
jgi:hypothetical protein